MSMGAAYAAGAGLKRRNGESYIPIISALDKLNSGSGRAGGSGGGSSSNLKERIYEDEKSRQRDIDNQYMSQHHGNLPPSAQEVAIDEAEKERQFKQGQFNDTMSLKKRELDESGRQFDVTTEQKGKQFDTTAGMAKERLSLEKNKDTREQGAYDLKMKQENDVQDYQKMMRAYMGGDYNAVMGWFVRNAPKDKDGFMRFPTIEPGSRPGEIMITPPGSDKPESMSVDDFGKVLWRMNPAYEFPKGAKEEADIAATSRKGGLTANDLEKNAINYAKGVTGEAGGPEFQAAYDQYKENYSGGNLKARPTGASKQPAGAAPDQGGKSVVQKQRNKRTGEVRITYSDGTQEVMAGEKAAAGPVNTLSVLNTPEETIPAHAGTKSGDTKGSETGPALPKKKSEAVKQIDDIASMIGDSPAAEGLSRLKRFIQEDIIEKDRPKDSEADSDSDSDDNAKSAKKKKSTESSD